MRGCQSQSLEVGVRTLIAKQSQSYRHKLYFLMTVLEEQNELDFVFISNTRVLSDIDNINRGKLSVSAHHPLHPFPPPSMEKQTE